MNEQSFVLQNLKYEYLEVIGNVRNRTSWDMVLVTSHIAWGKFDEGKSPVGVPANGVMEFVARGRDSSPTGTEGYAKWVLKGHPHGEVTITAFFNNPAVGSCEARIECNPKNIVSIQVEGKSQNSFHPVYTIG